MNKERRKELNVQWEKLEALKNAVAALQAEAEGIKSALEDIHSAEQEAFDNMPEGLQQGERGQASEQAIENIQTAIDALDSWDFASIVSEADEALEALDNATE